MSLLFPITSAFVLASVLITSASAAGEGYPVPLFRRFAPVLTGVVLGLLVLAAVRLGGSAEETVWLGLPEGSVRELECFAAEDGFRSANGNVLVSARLKRCLGVGGSAADAGGRVMVLLHGANLLPSRGSLLRVAVSDIFPDGGNLVLGGLTNQANTEWQSGLFLFRYRVYAGIETKIDLLSADSAPLLKALLLGTREDLSVREGELFRRAGCMHVLALSGMHLGIITGMALFVFGIFGRRKPAAVGAAFVVCWYLFLAGCRPSLVRAAVMVLTGTAVLIRGRRPEGRLILGVSFLAVSLIMPQSMRSISFTLSFAAVSGIVLTADRFHIILKRYLPPSVSTAISVSLASQLFTAPILIRSFGTLYPGGLIAAIPVGLLAGAYLGLGLVFVLVPGVVGITVWRGVFDILHRGMIESTRLVGRIPGIECPPIPATVIWAGTAAAVLTLLYAGDLRVRIKRIITAWKSRGTATGNRLKNFS